MNNHEKQRVSGLESEEVKITTIDLLRHGECIDGQCYRGSTDVALSFSGFQKMEQHIAAFLEERHEQKPPWDSIVTSPLVRCLDFSKKLAHQHNIPLTLDAGFKEMHFGEWEGQSIKSVWASQPKAVEAWVANPITSPPPSGEAVDVFAKRVLGAFDAAISNYMGEHFLLVSHGGVMRVLLVHCLGMPLLELNRFDIPYACISRVQVVTDQGKNYYRLLMHNVGVE